MTGLCQLPSDTLLETLPREKKKLTPKLMMKKLLSGLCLLALLAGCSGKGNDSQYEGKAQLTDSLHQLEMRQNAEEAVRAAEEAAALAATQARQDSLKQDSIKQEEKMRLKVSMFRDAWWDEKALKRIGFKKIKKKETALYDDGPSLYEETYTRTFNGRRIDVEGSAESCHGVEVIFYDNKDKEPFLKELKKIGSDTYEKYGFDYKVTKKGVWFEGCG